jgi:hypothetical protein
MVTPFRYTSRTFTTLLADLNAIAELADKPDFFKTTICGLGDNLHMNLNAVANNLYLRTCFTMRALVDLLKLIDYELSIRSQATGELVFYVDRTQIPPLTFTADELKGATPGSSSQSSLSFRSRTAKVFNAAAYTVTGVSTTNDTLTTATILQTGDLVRVASTVSPPSPLLSTEDYYVITTNGLDISLALTLADALQGNKIDITSSGSGVITVVPWSFRISCYQETYISAFFSIGSGDGTEWQEFTLPDLDILRDTISISVLGDTSWYRVDNWVDYYSTDKVFKVLYDADGTCRIRFGGGLYGVRPTGDIQIFYATGGGVLSNVSVINSITSYTGGSSYITGVSNTAAFTGGSEFESMESAKITAPELLKARDTFVTPSDGVYLSQNYAGVSVANVIRNAYGPLSCQVVIIPDGGGVPSSSLKTALQTYLIERTLMESMDVRVTDPTYHTVNVTGTAKEKTGYVWLTVLDYLTLAVQLYFGERTYEFVDIYNQSGIAIVVAAINAQFTRSYNSDNYTIIQGMLDNFAPEGSFPVPDFGNTIEESQLYAYCLLVVPGLSYVNITVPSFPVVLTEDEISTIGSISITQAP